jgi:integrase
VPPKKKTKAANGDGSIVPRKLKDGTTVYDVWISYKDRETGQTKRKPFYGIKTYEEAQKKRREATAAVDARTFVNPSEQPLSDYLTAFLDTHRVKAQTLAGYRKWVTLHINPHIGHIKLSKLTTRHLSDLYRKLEREGSPKGKGPLKPSSVLHVHNTVSRALKQAVTDGLLASNPATTAIRPSAAEAAAPEFAVLTAAEVSRFLNQEKGKREYAIWHFFFTTGVRRGEALGLRWSDIDFEAGTAGTAVIRQTVGVIRGKIVRETLPKSNKPRVIDLDAKTREVLKAYRKAQAVERLALGDRWVDEDLVFARDGFRLGPNQKAGGPRHPDRLARLFDRRLAKAKVPDVRLHDVRHTWATLALKNGVPVKVVQERLGHANPTITFNIYTHALPGMQHAAAEQVASLIA